MKSVVQSLKGNTVLGMLKQQYTNPSGYTVYTTRHYSVVCNILSVTVFRQESHYSKTQIILLAPEQASRVRPYSKTAFYYIGWQQSSSNVAEQTRAYVLSKIPTITSSPSTFLFNSMTGFIRTGHQDRIIFLLFNASSSVNEQ